MKSLLGTLAGMAAIVLMSGVLGYTYPADRSALMQPTAYSWPDTPQSAPQTVSPAELKARLDGGSKVVLLDARPTGEFEASHIKGAFNLPPSQFDHGYPPLRNRLDEDAELVVYCGGANCELDVRLAELLVAQGRSRVKVLSGGWSARLDAGYPKESGQSR